MRKLQLTLLPLLCGAFAAVGVAQQQSMLPYLPANTVMAMSMPDLDASMQEMASMPIAKMWAEPDVQKFVQDAREMVQQQIQKAMEQAKEMHKQGALPMDPEQLTSMRIKGASMAVTQLSMEAGDFGPMPTIGLMMHLEFGDTAQQWFGLMETGMGMLGQSGKMERGEVAVGDVKIATFKPVDAPEGNEMGLNVAMLKSGVIVGTLIGDVKTTVENMTAGKAVLGATDRYKNASKNLTTEGAEVEIFLQLDPVMDFAMSAMEVAMDTMPQFATAEIDMEGVRRGVDALGLGAMKAYGMSSRYENGKAVSRSFMDIPAPQRKGLMPTGNKTVDTAFLKWVPKDAVSFWAFTLEPAGIYDAFLGAVRAYDPQVATDMEADIAEGEKEMGFSIRDDLFGAIGDTMITWSMPMAQITSTPEMALLLKVNDDQKILKVLKAMAQMSDGEMTLEETEKRGVKSYQITLNTDDMQGGMNPLAQVNPVFTFHKGYMVLALQPSELRRIVLRMDRTEDDPKTDIRGNKEFAPYLESLPQGVAEISFTDWKASFESYYSLLSGVIGFLPPNEDIPFDWQMLPDSSVLTKHLFGSFTYTKADAEGFTTMGTSPWGPETWMTLGMLVMVGFGAAAAMPNVIR